MEVALEWMLKNPVFLIFLAILMIYIIHQISKKDKKIPPGPIGLPIFGYLPFIRKNTHLKFYELRKKYGGIFSLYLGNKHTVVLTDYPSVKEGLSNSAFLARPPNFPTDFLDEFNSTKTGFGGRYWIEQRRFILHVLRDLGFGKNKMEEYIKCEISYFIQKLKSFNGKPFIVKDMISPFVSNIICSLLFGRRMEYNSRERKLIDESLKDIGELLVQTSLKQYFPWLKPFHSLISLSNYKKAIASGKKLSDFEEEEIEKHKHTLDPDNIRDYIDGYLIELKQREEDSKSYFNKNMMKQTLQLLLGAGTRTVMESLTWSFLIMAKYQDVQKRVQREIDNVIGKREPMWADHKLLPYTQAVIFEVQRWKTIIPVNLQRYCIHDTTIQGYKIPKGTIIMINIWAVHNDPEYWKDPETFRPERFLDEAENKTIRHDLFIPFSLGKMSCAGETMAQKEIFLFFVTTMQQFFIKPNKGEEINLEGILELTYSSKLQNLCFLERENDFSTDT